MKLCESWKIKYSFPLYQNLTTHSQKGMIRDTNRRVARGAVLRTGRMAEAAGHSEGSYLASVSNSRPTEYRIFLTVWVKGSCHLCFTPALSHWLGTSQWLRATLVGDQWLRPLQQHTQSGLPCYYDSVLPTFVTYAATSPHLARCFSGSPGHRKAHFSLCLVSMATERRNHCARGSLGGKKARREQEIRRFIYHLLPIYLITFEICLTNK